MNYKTIVLLLLLSFINISCQEQDYYNPNDSTQILVNYIGQNFISLKLSTTNTDEILQLLISREDNFENKIDTVKDIILSDSISYSSINFNDKKNGLVFNSKIELNKNILITDLELLNDYVLALYRNKEGKSLLIQKLRFSTVVESPTIHSKNLTFSNVTDTKMTVSFQPGNGQGRIILIRKDSAPEFPVDGIEYNFNVKYGSDSSKIGKNTYCIYKTSISADNKFTVNNLKPGRYYFAVFEFNGNGKHINYLGEFSGNIRVKNTSLTPPVALPADIIDLNNFVAKWEKLPDADYFLLDIAEDENFVNIVFPYENVDVGDSNLVEIELPFNIEERNVFYRVRAFANGTITGSSNTIKVEKKDIKGK